MIESIAHKGLKAFCETESEKGINSAHVGRLRRLLSVLDGANSINDIMAFQSFGCHPLKGNLNGFYAVSVTGSWRLVFRFDNGKARDIDYKQYH